MKMAKILCLDHILSRQSSRNDLGIVGAYRGLKLIQYTFVNIL